jgi:hypothetical protein
MRRSRSRQQVIEEITGAEEREEDEGTVTRASNVEIARSWVPLEIDRKETARRRQKVLRPLQDVGSNR